MLKVKVDYPTRAEEQEVIRRSLSGATTQTIAAVVSPEEILKARETVRKVYMDEKIEQYILDIVFASRQPKDFGLEKLAPMILYGGSPRASINLAIAAKTQAFMRRRGFVIPDDVRSVCHDVMRHRIGLTYEAEASEMTSESIITSILNKVEVP